MLLTTNAVTLKTRGILVSTTDMVKASLLNKRVTLSRLIGTTPAHFEIVERNKVLIYAGRELYELEV